MASPLILRADGKTVDIGYEEAQQADITAKAKRVIAVDSSGNDLVGSNDSYTQTIENNSTGQAIYIGFAVPGTAKSSAGWLIKKLTYSGYSVTDVQFAEGETTFDKVWDNRASYSYS